jgi:hypothetical protein
MRLTKIFFAALIGMCAVNLTATRAEAVSVTINEINGVLSADVTGVSPFTLSITQPGLNVQGAIAISFSYDSSDPNLPIPSTAVIFFYDVLLPGGTIGHDHAKLVIINMRSGNFVNGQFTNQMDEKISYLTDPTNETGSLGSFFGGTIFENGGTQQIDAGLSDLGVTLITGTAATPLPAALPLFATGLGALGLLGWRRKRKAAV